MKKILVICLLLLFVLTCGLFSACGPKSPIKADENTVIITASDSSFDFDGKTLKDFMDYLQEDKQFTYSIDNGMITTINGKSNTTNSYWMLYTSDAQNANTDWGSFEHEGSIYGSATLGAEALPIKEGCVYIWAYQSF